MIITNQSNIAFNYVLPDGQIIAAELDSNEVTTEILTYTSVITNTGSIPVTDVIFKDEIPVGTTFVNGSVTVNGVSFPAYNPQTGFFAANLTPQASVTVTFQVQVN